MDLVLCHTTADFDALGAAVGLCVLHPGTRIVLTGGCHPTVRDFLALHRDEYPLIERRSVNPQQIRSIAIVDASTRDRLGKAAEWLDLPQLNEIALFDHHLEAHSDIPATVTQIEAVGATTTLIVEKLREKTSPPLRLEPSEATVMALGIHVDTGSLTFEGATARDANALAWLMEQGASLRVIAEYVEPGLSAQLQDLLKEALNNLRSETVHGNTVAWVLLTTDDFVPGLSSLASRLLDLTETDALLLGNVYKFGDKQNSQNIDRNFPESPVSNRLSIIGRSRIDNTNLSTLFKPLGGGGHASAASLALRDVDPVLILNQLASSLKAQIPHPPTARELMSSPVRSIRPETSVGEAHRILLRYGHSGLSVVDKGDRLAGIISRRDIDIALHHGFSHAPVKGYMTPQLKTITPNTLLPEIESLMVTYDIGRLPVLENGLLVGIVTRTDVLRELHQQKARDTGNNAELSYYHKPELVEHLLRSGISPELWQLLSIAANMCNKRGWQLYIVGGAVRDLLLSLKSGGQDAHPTTRLNSCGTGILPVAEPSLGRQDAHPTTTLNSCGTGILPVAEPSLGGQDAHPTTTLNSCGTGILPVAEPSLGGQDAHPTTTLNSCGTGILPVAEPSLGGQDAHPTTTLNSCGTGILPVALTDIDLVVDGDARSGNSGAGVELASELQKLYPTARLDIHGQFQTAALLWHKDSPFGSLWLDIATARTEFYAYPAANPEVEASSIRQDLYRRDFTINALAVRLGVPRSGELLDFFGGLLDLESKQIRVLHANSLIEDPTRIYRAVRFAVRLGFTIEPQTEGYIRHALASGIYDRIQGENGRAPALETRLKSELKYILQAPYWQVALQMLGDLQALRCIHPTLDLNRDLWQQLRLLERFLHRRKEEGRRKKKKLFPMPNSQSPMPNAPCPIPHAQFPMPNSRLSIFLIGRCDWKF
ncbi:CBS domain-containing protein [Tychonema bourrellyi]|uniref:CBS domain-containing protein n=1 Tax=Tychonema bourrellyi TaxID=54313 RepID=UPI001FE4D0CF|nr:CBS domain-containing protein [Tychonema bourrellyi]